MVQAFEFKALLTTLDRRGLIERGGVLEESSRWRKRVGQKMSDPTKNLRRPATAYRSVRNEPGDCDGCKCQSILMFRP